MGRHGWLAYRGGALAQSAVGLDEVDVLKSVTTWATQDASGHWWAPSRISLYLSGALSRPFLLPELSGLAGKERLLAVEAAAKKRTGLASDLHLWLSPMLAGRSRDSGAHQLGAAVPASLISDLVLAFKRSRGFKLSLIQPLWALALRAACAEDDTLDLLIVRDPDSVTVLASAAEGASNTNAQIRTGFASAVSVEAPLGAGQQRHAVLRLLSGLEHEPTHARQFAFGVPDASSDSTTVAKASSHSAAAFPMSDSWALTAFDVGGV